ncbi:GlxA family transcriptional regulator [Shimia thalassica]|uniref:GlxA family transcriptional regulator n=1 Tax=Shimia thalassica TaxID=1715693 RepID=UPI0026E418D9|nr:GlxA family transcriptional regulator [Shimia thalassica]MDO6799909.1 GlxA family transcriptional regulator [Shimia thalassica]
MTKPMALSAQKAQPVHPVDPKKYVFLLLEEYSLLSFTCAVEALRMANGYEGKTFFEWRVLSETGNTVYASNGLSTGVDGEIEKLSRQDTLIVVGGDNIASRSTPKIMSWLRREARSGVTVGALGTGSYTLAMAGLLIDRPVTTHWEYHNTFVEVFPGMDLRETLFAIDTDRPTCAGGAASIDMMLHLIERDFGRDLANYVSDLMVYTSPRTEQHSQRLSLQARSGARHTKFAEAIEIMARNIEDPLSPADVAMMVNLSGRQLERLFKKHLNTTPKTYYTGLRLQKARELLFQTNMSLSEICFASGFNSQTHFSKSYRARFGVSPSNDSCRG